MTSLIPTVSSTLCLPSASHSPDFVFMFKSTGEDYIYYTEMENEYSIWHEISSVSEELKFGQNPA